MNQQGLVEGSDDTATRKKTRGVVAAKEWQLDRRRARGYQNAKGEKVTEEDAGD